MSSHNSIVARTSSPDQITTAEAALHASLTAVTRDDVVRVRIEDAKIELLVRQAGIKAALDGIQTEVVGHNKVIADIGITLLEETDITPYQAAVDTFAATFGHKFAKEEVVTKSLSANDQVKQTFEISITSPIGRGYSSSIVKTITIKFPAAAKTAVKQLLALGADAAKHQAELGDIRRKISDLPNEAERFRAKLSRMALQQAGGFGATVLGVIDNTPVTPKLLGSTKA